MSLLALLPDRPGGTRCPLVTDIKEAVAEEFGVSVAGIEGPCKDQRLVLPRQLAMWIARKATRHSLPRLGDFFGNRDHSTVWVAIRRAEDVMSSDADYWHKAERILRDLDTKLAPENNLVDAA